MRNKIYIVILVAVSILGLFIINQWITSSANSILGSSKSRQVIPVVDTEKINTAQNKQKSYAEVTRKTRPDPSGSFRVSIFWGDGEEIASCKNKGDEMYDVVGLIPDGKVKFYEEFQNTHGTEFYRNGKRHGLFKEFYEDDKPKREADFVDGQKMTNTVYYGDGKVRMVENYEDALRFVEDKEAGEGKVYYRDGTLMYEWSLTNAGRGGYKRSYNQNGVLVEEKLFDHNGEMTEIRKF